MSKSNYTFIDCNGLAGFMSYGCVKAGMEMVLRTGTLDFGSPLVELNRKHLGQSWDADFSDESSEWPRRSADAIIGCPPCSGWSVWSGKANRGPDAAAHEHTRAFMRYAGVIKPKVIVFECVQQAYTQGRETMLKYRDMVEEISGKKYDLHHVMHNNLQLGGFSYRPRYFWVAVRRGMKFGASVTDPKSIPLVMDVIGDLEHAEQKWEPQKIKTAPSKYVKNLRRKDSVVDGHIGVGGLHQRRVDDIFDVLGNEDWAPRENQGEALRRAYKKNGNKFPQSWLSVSAKVKRRDFDLGFSQPCRWSKESWCHVLTGGGLYHVVHPTQPRLLTHREAARIQGLPDDWLIEGVRSYGALKAVWGKAVAAQAGRWIGETVIAALDGQPSGPDGEKIGDREFMHHTDKGFSRNYVKKKWIEKEA